jgi:hypothetical protein
MHFGQINNTLTKSNLEGGGVIVEKKNRYTSIVKTSITREGEKHTDE